MSLASRSDAVSPTWSGEFAEEFSFPEATGHDRVGADSFREDGPHIEVQMIAGLPSQLVSAYASAAAKHAYGRSLDAGSWFVSVAVLKGVWGEGPTFEEARGELELAILDWVAVRRANHQTIPVVDGFDLND